MLYTNKSLRLLPPPGLLGFLLGFTLLSLSSRILTPNGDRRNDSVVFSLANPADAAVTGRVYTLRGHFVADMRPGPAANSLAWDGRSNGRRVPTGIYVYVLQGGGALRRGTLVVIR